MGRKGAAAAAASTALGAGATGEQPNYKALLEALLPEYDALASDLDKVSQTAEEFKSRHSGLQGKYQQEQEKWVKDTDAAISMRDQLAKLSGEREALVIERDTLKTTAEKAAAAVTEAAAKADRLTLIARDYPALLPFEADGLLPAGTGDDFKAKIAKFNEKLAGKGTEAVTEFRKGETPPPPAGVTPNTSAALFKQANDALREGKPMADYDRLYDQGLALKAQGK